MIASLKKLVKAVLKVGIPVNTVTKPFFACIYYIHVLIRESLIWAFRFFYYEPLFKSQCKAVGRDFCMEQLPYIVNSGVIVIGNNVRLSGKPSFAFSTKIFLSPSVTIGDNTFIGHQTSFMVARGVTIGKDCFIAGGTRFADNDGHPLDHADRKNHLPPKKEDVKEIRVGNDVWIGAQAVILKGVTIGDRAIIGTHAIVTKDVPPDTIIAGNPAKIIKSFA